MSVDEHPDSDTVLDAYFTELVQALACLPDARREQLVAEIHEHVDDAVALRPPESAWEMRELLQRVGSPKDIARAALAEEEPIPADRRRSPRRLASAAGLLLAVGVGVGLTLSLTAHRAPGVGTRARAASTKGVATSGSITSASNQRVTPPATPGTSTPAGAGTVPPTTPTTTAPTTTVPAGFAVLPPATVPPKVAECTQQLMFGADGDAGPLTCPNGQLNQVAWTFYAQNGLSIMALGPFATPEDTERAMCNDLPKSTIPIEMDAYHLAATYYGWSFGIDPTYVINPADTPNPCQ